MKGLLISLVGALIVSSVVACGSTDEGNGSDVDAQVADLAQFPTPTRPQAAPQPTSQPETIQAQAVQREGAEDTSDVEPLTQEELQQLRQRLRSGELSQEEAQQTIQRLQSQLGGGQAGGGLGGPIGIQAVGTIETVEGGAIVVATEMATVTAMVGEDTNVSITSVLEPSALTLTDGAQVMVVSERVEGSNLARAITFLPEGQGGLGRGRLGGGQGGAGDPGRAQVGTGGLGGGQGGLGGLGVGQGGQVSALARPLMGTIQSIADDGFTLETQQGPLPIIVNEETQIIQTKQGTLDDLRAGMQVRVTGAEGEDGGIDARSVTVTPAGLEQLRGPGGS